MTCSAAIDAARGFSGQLLHELAAAAAQSDGGGGGEHWPLQQELGTALGTAVKAAAAVDAVARTPEHEQFGNEQLAELLRDVSLARDQLQSVRSKLEALGALPPPPTWVPPATVIVNWILIVFIAVLPGGAVLPLGTIFIPGPPPNIIIVIILCPHVAVSAAAHADVDGLLSSRGKVSVPTPVHPQATFQRLFDVCWDGAWDISARRGRGWDEPQPMEVD